jgi:hypothetical protein
MQLKSLCIIATLILLLAFGGPSSAQTREQLVEQVKSTLTEIHRAQQAYHLEWDRYADSLPAIGVDPMALVHKDYWAFQIVASGAGFVVEARGAKVPVLGEVWRVDQSGAVR